MSTANTLASLILAAPDRREHTSSMTPHGRDEYFMSLALILAHAASLDGEVPVGCVIVRDGVIISCGFNDRERGRNAVNHAELSAISSACEHLGGWRLPGCVLYVTLEPCLMCAGAIINAHIPEVVIAAKDSRAGAMGSVLAAQSYPLGWKPLVRYLPSMERRAVDMLSGFFARRRKCKG